MLIRKDGRFVPKALHKLNPDHLLKAVYRADREGTRIRAKAVKIGQILVLNSRPFSVYYAVNPMPASLSEFIQSLPKTETHLHVEGALPYELLTAWEPARYPEDPPFRRANYRYATFPDFERYILLDNALPWFTTPQRYHEAAKVMFGKHVAQNVRYVETSFHLPVTKFIQTPGPEIIAAIRAAVPAGLEVRIFTGMLRSDIAGRPATGD